MVYKEVVAKEQSKNATECSDNYFHRISDAGTAYKYSLLVVNNQICWGIYFSLKKILCSVLIETNL